MTSDDAAAPARSSQPAAPLSVRCSSSLAVWAIVGGATGGTGSGGSSARSGFGDALEVEQLEYEFHAADAITDRVVGFQKHGLPAVVESFRCR